MKRNVTSLSLVAAAALVSLGVAAPASAELSATGGLVSEYYFRGVGLGDAGAYGSLDYSVAGFTLGTWIIDDGSASNDGLETDFYAGYGMSHGDNFSWNVAYNRYEYTYTSDYEDEIAVSLGLPVGLSLQLVRGEMHDEEGVSPDLDTGYRYLSLGWNGEVFGVLLGDSANIARGDESSYSHFEVSASGEVSTIAVGVTAGVVFNANDAAGDDTASGDGYIVFDISKTFTF